MLDADSIGTFLNSVQIEFVRQGPLCRFDNARPFDDSDTNSLSWSKDAKADVSKTYANVLIVSNAALSIVPKETAKSIFFVESPRMVFMKLLQAFFGEEQKIAKGLHDSGLFEFHESHAIGRGAHVSPDARLGDNVTIHPQVVIYPNVTIGNNVEIGAGSVIGGTGFGYVRNANGELTHFPHLGRVVIEDNVEIGANTCIDRGGLGETLVSAGTKIGNFCQIAHNVSVGKNCLIAGRVQIGGGSQIGDETNIWPSVTISNKINIGSGCDIRIGSVVITNVTDGKSVSGNFAIDHSKTLFDFARKRRKL